MRSVLWEVGGLEDDGLTAAPWSMTIGYAEMMMNGGFLVGSSTAASSSPTLFHQVARWFVRNAFFPRRLLPSAPAQAVVAGNSREWCTVVMIAPTKSRRPVTIATIRTSHLELCRAPLQHACHPPLALSPRMRKKLTKSCNPPPDLI